MDEQTIVENIKDAIRKGESYRQLAYFGTYDMYLLSKNEVGLYVLTVNNGYYSDDQADLYRLRKETGYVIENENDSVEDKVDTCLRWILLQSGKHRLEDLGAIISPIGE